MRKRLLAAGAVIGLAASATSALAAPACSTGALNALHVTDLSVTEARPVAASGATPAYCDVKGTVVTKGEGLGNGQARFAMQLPDSWQQRFLFLGVGGNAGALVPSANATDRRTALAKGYVMILTDAGHVGDGVVADWSRLPDGKPNAVKRADYFYRAAHNVTQAGKAFAQAYYAAPVDHAYFDGCSNGGRMAMMEAERYPRDYDGIIAGDPMMNDVIYAARAALQKALQATPDAYIPQATLKAIDARVTGQCDAIDGAKDGLVQDPAACKIQVKDLVCRAGETGDCLNPAQAKLMSSFTTPFRDSSGKVIFLPWQLTDLQEPMGFGFMVEGTAAPDLANLHAPWANDPESVSHGWQLQQAMLEYWIGLGPKATFGQLDIDPATNVLGPKTLALIHQSSDAMNTRDPARLKPFIAAGKKMIIYHGSSDPLIPPSQSIAFYQDLMRQQGGLSHAQQSVRMFLVPGMHHCQSGPSPDQFDTLSAIEGWVEHGTPPTAIQASTPAANAVQHHLPLCAWPQQGRYKGTGDINDPTNWQCQPTTKG